MNFKISNSTIPVEIYLKLREITGLSPKSFNGAVIGLKNSLHSVMIQNDEGSVIAMGRVIGDGGLFCQVVDICVDPEYQGQGIGKMIMTDIREYIDSKLPESCYISLLADGEAYKLYQHFGFQDTLPKSKGMFIKK